MWGRVFSIRNLKKNALPGSASILILVAGLVWACRPRPVGQLIFSPTTVVLPADGTFHRAVRLHRSDGKSIGAREIFVTGLRSRVVSDSEGIFLELQAPGMGQERLIRVEGIGTAPVVLMVTFTPDSSDVFGDGTPEISPPGCRCRPCSVPQLVYRFG